MPETPQGHQPIAQWISAIVRYRSDHPGSIKILDTIDRLLERPYATHALIHGEPGTGKEGLARALHAAMHPDPSAPFVKVATGNRDRLELTRELFGTTTENGAFARADRGTLYLDDVARLDPEVQARLAPALRGRFRASGETGTRTTRVTVIAAVDIDLLTRVRSGDFRDDLYYRLARIELHVPPLRERPTDIVPAAIWTGNHVLEVHNRKERLCLRADAEPRDIILTDDAADALTMHPWPGNFRELDVIMERALLLYHRDARTLDATAIRAALSGPDTPVDR
jgi:DNA-binding NtrC family response regulator